MNTAPEILVKFRLNHREMDSSPLVVRRQLFDIPEMKKSRYGKIVVSILTSRYRSVGVLKMARR
jgi:hypothetical protein